MRGNHRLYLARLVSARVESRPNRDLAKSQMVRAFITAFIKPPSAGRCFDFLPGPLPKSAFGLPPDRKS